MDFKVIDLGFQAPVKRRILVVDDELAIQSLVYDALSEDYQLVSAHNGKEGVVRAENITPELILMDIMMPDINGYQAVKLLSSNPATKSIPVIVMTARDFDKSTVNMLKSEPNVVAFLAKPFRVNDLREKVKQALEKKV